jgi:hypothetical protein
MPGCRGDEGKGRGGATTVRAGGERFKALCQARRRRAAWARDLAAEAPPEAEERGRNQAREEESSEGLRRKEGAQRIRVGRRRQRGRRHDRRDGGAAAGLGRKGDPAAREECRVAEPPCRAGGTTSGGSAQVEAPRRGRRRAGRRGQRQAGSRGQRNEGLRGQRNEGLRGQSMQDGHKDEGEGEKAHRSPRNRGSSASLLPARTEERSEASSSTRRVPCGELFSRLMKNVFGST